MGRGWESAERVLNLETRKLADEGKPIILANKEADISTATLNIISEIGHLLNGDDQTSESQWHVVYEMTALLIDKYRHSVLHPVPEEYKDATKIYQAFFYVIRYTKE